MDQTTPPETHLKTGQAEEQCEFEFAPGVRCMMVAGHDEPYYPYLDYGQWGKYSDILSEGTRHEALAPPIPLPPREEWTGMERRDTVATYPVFYPRNPSDG